MSARAQRCRLLMMHRDEALVVLALLAAGGAGVPGRALVHVIGRAAYATLDAVRCRLARREANAELMRTRWGFVLIGHGAALEALFDEATTVLAQQALKAGAAGYEDAVAAALVAA